jgi:hypothetical protein
LFGRERRGDRIASIKKLFNTRGKPEIFDLESGRQSKKPGILLPLVASTGGRLSSDEKGRVWDASINVADPRLSSAPIHTREPIRADRAKWKLLGGTLK